MHMVMILLMIAAFVFAIPSLVRTFTGDFTSSTFYLDIFLDIVLVGFAVLTKSIVAVVLAEIICNVFINWIYQKKFAFINSMISK